MSVNAKIEQSSVVSALYTKGYKDGISGLPNRAVIARDADSVAFDYIYNSGYCAGALDSSPEAWACGRMVDDEGWIVFS